MSITFNPIFPFSHLIIVCAILILGVWALRGVIDRWRTMHSRPTRRVWIALMTCLATVCLMGAALNPLQVQTDDSGNLHLVVLVDVSASMERTQVEWPVIMRQLQQITRDGIAGMPETMRQNATASLIEFGTSLRESPTMPLADLPGAIGRLPAPAADDGTTIDVALSRAFDHIAASAGRGEVLLVTDGNQTMGDALGVARIMGERGMPVHVLPVVGRNPEIAIESINLPHQIRGDEPTWLRGVVRNHSPNTVAARVFVDRNAGLLPQESGLFAMPNGTAVDLPALNNGDYRSLRLSLLFGGVGLQYLDTTLQTDGGTHRRRSYTHVVRPPRFLFIGHENDADGRWLVAIPEDVALIDERTPASLSAQVDLSQYDGVILNAVRNDALPPGLNERLAQTVERDGLGLFFVNGDHDNLEDTDDSVLRTYHETPIDPILPVSSEPMDDDEPPSRQIVIVIDASGSMGDWRLKMVKRILNVIIPKYFTERDLVTVLAFTTGSSKLLDNVPMDEAGLQRAYQAINGISAGGGTDPSLVIQELNDARLTNCGLLFFSDGGFNENAISTRPECATTVFHLANVAGPPPASLTRLSIPIVVTPDFNPEALEIPFLGEGRGYFFEPGNFMPVPPSRYFSTQELFDAVLPNIGLNGTAVNYIRAESEMVGVRPGVADPVVAFTEAGNGLTGAFLTSLPPTWYNSDEGADAIQRYLLNTVAYNARDRYTFQVDDDGQRLRLQIAIQNADGSLPEIEIPYIELKSDTANIPLELQTVSDAPATYTMFIDMPRTADAQKVALYIDERGPDAVRPQHIPLLIPPSGALQNATTTEANTYGVNQPLLNDIQSLTNGIDVIAATQDTNEGFAFFQHAVREHTQTVFWPLLATLSAVFLFLSVALQRFGG